jgi:FtsP/CotA-like multicopper oxidase with cupredoxin domain
VGLIREVALKSRVVQFQLGSIFRGVVVIVNVVACLPGWTQTRPSSSRAAQVSEVCPRPLEGSIVTQPTELRSENGGLTVSLKIRNSLDADGNMRYCYVDGQGHLAPTRRLWPGDVLSLTLKNELSLPASSLPHALNHANGRSAQNGKHDPCAGGPMTAGSTNLHFHGLSVPAVCHQDETLTTIIEPGDQPFEYRIRIPETQPPGLYWYHPHVHGFSEEQILGGASGALIVEGMESAVPRVAGVPERVFVIRDQKISSPSVSVKPDPLRPTKQLSINYIPVPYPKYPPATIKMKPGESELWRVLNASADTYLDLSVVFAGKRQNLGLVALDGVPLHFGEPGSDTYAPEVSDVFLPPAARAEFIVTGPPEGVSAQLVTGYINRGASDDDKPVGRRAGDPVALRIGQDDVDPERPLASIVAEPQATSPAPIEHTSAKVKPPASPLSSVPPTRKRKLFFSERLIDPNDPQSATQFFITEEGHAPALFDPRSKEPTVTVRQGEVEDWTIENRSRESHTFHIHQLHFIVVGEKGLRWEEPTLRDTIDVPAWGGFGSYPSVTVRLDFRDPGIVGTFPFHCHILQHLDGGMMGTVSVKPTPRDRVPSQER